MLPNGPTAATIGAISEPNPFELDLDDDDNLETDAAVGNDSALALAPSFEPVLADKDFDEFDDLAPFGGY
jgi:hypothetical protein